MEASIPVEVRQFVESHIRSLDQLEVLLLVSALPDREWSVDDVYNVVRSSPGVVAERLESFEKAGILVRSQDPPLYQYRPRTQDLAHAISSLSGIYKMSRHRIVELIYAPSRTDDPITSFTDAFRFRKKE
jgi:hypothetical protein